MSATITTFLHGRSGEERDILEGMDDVRFQEFASPIGQIGVLASPKGVVKVLFEVDDLEANRARFPKAEQSLLVTEQLTEYFSGRRREFTVPFDFRFVSGFRAEVLRELAQVPFGQAVTYGELAQKAGSPKAVRAVGSACANNPLPLLVPCHRVLRADGTLGGYRGGAEAKRFLLELEGIDVAGIH